MDYIWGASVVDMRLRMMIDLWKKKKKYMVKKKQLQEIARPSDTMIFCQDMKKEIEKGTAALLERYVAMEMRPIHNSVKKLEDRAISGAKSVVGWIRSGGKKNREITERIENR